MPDIKMDVKMFVKWDIPLSNYCNDLIRGVTAIQMSCKESEVTADEVDLLIIRCSEGEGRPMDPQGIFTNWPTLSLFSNYDILVEVAAYDYGSRMECMPDRLRAIVGTVKDALGDYLKVSITFLPVQDGCWFAA